MKKHRLPAVLALMLLAALFTPAVRADFGPKDRLTVYVTNPPEELYYLDLLYENESGDEVYGNLTEEELASLNADMLERLRENIAGLTPALTVGTRIPTYGSLEGEADGLRRKHTFSYYGLPQTYRIIIVTESGSVRISDEYTRRAMQSSITYDYETGMAEIPPLWGQYLRQFVWTLVMTLAIEGALLAAFRFSLRENGGVFLLVNLLTQLVLTAVVGTALIRSGPLNAYGALFLCELGVTAAETVAYAFLLRGQSRGRRIAYGITANLVSWAVSGFCCELLYTALVRIA